MMKNKMYLMLGGMLLTAVAFTSCKSTESAYKKAYEKARLQSGEQGAAFPETTVVEVTPVTPVTPATSSTSTDTPPVRQEKVQLIAGSGLKDYSVVVGSFSLKANAEGLHNTLKSRGYDAQVAYNSVNSMYRVIASTHDDRVAAAQSRDQLRVTYSDAWLLYNR